MPTPRTFTDRDLKKLDKTGLNHQAIIPLSQLSDDITISIENHLGDISEYAQLILFASSGEQLWTSVSESKVPEPIDAHSTKCVRDVLNTKFDAEEYCFLYPKYQGVPLQQLGAMVGWHHESPLKIGINEQCGLWMAYRVAVLVRGEFVASSLATNKMSPCLTCESKACISSCPADVMKGGDFNLNACMQYRIAPQSQCEKNCMARNACPVKADLKYGADQMAYHYGRSLKMIKRSLVS